MTKSLIQKISPSILVILIFALMVPLVNFNHHYYDKKEGVIIWDVKSYYAFLPATFIYKDLSFEFRNDYPERNLHDWIWTSETPTGKQAVVTSVGLSMLYAPFFLIGHAAAHLHPDFDAFGYSKPYHVALTFSALIYFLLAFLILRKLLLRHFDEKTTALTLFAIGAGTNLFHYISYEAPMSHAYNFFLIILFTHLLIKWKERVNMLNTILLGLVIGLIALVRPTNIIVVLAIPLIGTKDLGSLVQNFRDLLRKWPFILLMIAAFLVVWIPQFMYWHYVSGKILYFSYSEIGGKFYWTDPQVYSMLFSYKKGWYIYTPIMILATIGLIRLYKDKNPYFWPVLTIFILHIYVLSSWWSWWFGGAFGNRSMIDIYGFLAFPLAAFISIKWQFRAFKYISIATILILIFFNQFQVQQYRNGAIHYWWNNKATYWENFMKLNATCKYWKLVQIPDYDLARKGIYKAINPVEGNETIPDSLLIQCMEEKLAESTMDLGIEGVEHKEIIRSQAKHLVENKQADQGYRELQIAYLRNYIHHCNDWKMDLEKMALKSKLSYEELLQREARLVFEEYTPSYVEMYK